MLVTLTIVGTVVRHAGEWQLWRCTKAPLTHNRAHSDPLKICEAEPSYLTQTVKSPI